MAEAQAQAQAAAQPAAGRPKKEVPNTPDVNQAAAVAMAAEARLPPVEKEWSKMTPTEKAAK